MARTPPTTEPHVERPGRAVDLHTDETLDPAILGLADLAHLVTATGFPHGVVASHCIGSSRGKPHT